MVSTEATPPELTDAELELLAITRIQGKPREWMAALRKVQDEAVQEAQQAHAFQLAELRSRLDREIQAIKDCPHCGGESVYDRGRIDALRWVGGQALSNEGKPDEWRVHDHGPAEGRGPNCREYPINGRLLGRCLIDLMLYPGG